MLSFFSSPHCAPAAPEPSFTTLFRLIDDFDSYNREVQAPQPRQRHHIRRTVTTTFKPKFDVRETASAYELHGELPGIEKQNLNIEFTDPQTIVVRGRVERTYESKPVTEEQTSTTTTTEPEATPAAEEKTSDADETASNASSHGWHHATVEDDPEEPATPPGASTPTETPNTEVAKPVALAAPVQKAPEAPKEKVWLYERSIGQFQRAFTFPTRVEHENVSANLENGVLSITVPKAPKHQLRRVAIF